mmetsp:Transcript_54866/g.158741  ORF Transcript_54866/g.158741 Transcript_54866/m.158741 type:complete len:239 (+) Transcript_54866:527-1243(+)
MAAPVCPRTVSCNHHRVPIACFVRCRWDSNAPRRCPLADRFRQMPSCTGNRSSRKRRPQMLQATSRTSASSNSVGASWRNPGDAGPSLKVPGAQLCHAPELGAVDGVFESCRCAGSGGTRGDSAQACLDSCWGVATIRPEEPQHTELSSQSRRCCQAPLSLPSVVGGVSAPARGVHWAHPEGVDRSSAPSGSRRACWPTPVRKRLISSSCSTKEKPADAPTAEPSSSSSSSPHGQWRP